MTSIRNNEQIIKDINNLKSQLETRITPATELPPPRYFTIEELEDLISSIPHFRTQIKPVATALHKNLVSEEKNKLRFVKIAPDGYQEFKQLYINKHVLSKAVAGEGSGMHAAEAISHGCSQGRAEPTGWSEWEAAV